MTEEQILKLSGGGDWHVAYILLYGPRRLEKMKEEEEDDVTAPEIDVPMQRPLPQILLRLTTRVITSLHYSL